MRIASSVKYLKNKGKTPILRNDKRSRAETNQFACQTRFLFHNVQLVSTCPVDKKTFRAQLLIF